MSGFIINPYAFGGSSATLTMPLLVTWEAGGDNSQTFVNDGTATGSVQWNGFTAKRDGNVAYGANGSTYGLDCRFNNDSVRYYNISGMNFGSQDFTFEVFVKNDDSPPGTNRMRMIDIVDSSNTRILSVLAGGDSNRRFSFACGGVNDLEVGSLYSLGSWYHLCMERTGDTVYCYVDGTQVTTLSLSTSQDIGDADEMWWGESYSGGEDMRGFLDDTRITFGGNVYGGSFSVPSMDLGDTST